MRAVTWHGRADVQVDTVPDPVIQEPTDVIVQVTSSGICGSDLHLIKVMAPFMTVGDVMGHEPMGVVREVGPEVTTVKPGDRVVVPFNISCGTCWMCGQGLQSQCGPHRTASRASGLPCSAIPSCTGGSPAGRPSTCGCRSATPCPSRCPTGRRTIGSSTSRTCCRRRGRRSSTPRCRRAARCWRRRHGGPRLPRGRPRAEGDGDRPGRDHGKGHARGRHRPAGRAEHRHRSGPSRRDDLAVRRLRRDHRSTPPDADVRQADPVPHGAGERPTLGARDSAAAGGRRSAGRRRLRHPPRALEQAPEAYANFREKKDGAVKVLLEP
jgi:hypothetical protein